MKRKKKKLTAEFWREDAENQRKLAELIAARRARGQAAREPEQKP
jgi:hypothetical protein